MSGLVLSWAVAGRVSHTVMAGGDELPPRARSQLMGARLLGISPPSEETPWVAAREVGRPPKVRCL